MDYLQFTELLRARRSMLSPRLQDVAQFVLNNPEDVAMLTTMEIAKAAKVPASALTRFTQELGFEKFSDLQKVFRTRLVGPRLSYADRLHGMTAKASEAEGPIDLSNPYEVLEVFSSSALGSLMHLLESQREAPLVDFVESIRAAAAVHIVAGRGAYGVAAYTFYGLSAVGKRAFLIDNTGYMREQQLQALGEEDVLLAISFDDYTRETLEIAESAEQNGRTVVAITDNELSPLCGSARYTLFVKEARLGHFRSQVPAMVLCQSIVASVGRSGDRAIGKS